MCDETTGGAEDTDSSAGGRAPGGGEGSQEGTQLAPAKRRLAGGGLRGHGRTGAEGAEAGPEGDHRPTHWQEGE